MLKYTRNSNGSVNYIIIKPTDNGMHTTLCNHNDKENEEWIAGIENGTIDDLFIMKQLKMMDAIHRRSGAQYRDIERSRSESDNSFSDKSYSVGRFQ